MITLADATPWAPMVAQWGTLVAVFLVAFLNQWNAGTVKRRDEQAAQKAQLVVEQLKSSDASKDQKMGEIHALVNSNMELQLKKICLLTEQLALLTKSPAAIEAARLARLDLETHITKQKKVDQSKDAFELGRTKGAADAAIEDPRTAAIKSLQEHIEAEADVRRKGEQKK